MTFRVIEGKQTHFGEAMIVVILHIQYLIGMLGFFCINENFLKLWKVGLEVLRIIPVSY